ncbi:SIR2 family protein [Bdellovibrionota bacterium FG-1]
MKGQQLGVPTMKPIAADFTGMVGAKGDLYHVTAEENSILLKHLGLNIADPEYANNLERLMEILYSLQFVLKRSHNDELKKAANAVHTVIEKITRFILRSCTKGKFSEGDESLLGLYQAFYRKLVYRDRALPRPWVFSTNYDLFNETAMDRLGIPYCNGFSGTVERRFNPATFRYSLAEQFDISSRKWTAVDNFVYLCKLHGSINWIEESKGLFPIRELQQAATDGGSRVMIYPTPAKQNASLGSPYSDLFREFQSRIVREQSVLFALGYSFSDEHLNNIIFQALTVPTFRLVALLPPDADGVPLQLRSLADPRIWIIGGDGPSEGRKAHYFDTFIDKFMPEPPGDKVDTAVAKVLQTLIGGAKSREEEDVSDDL